MKRTLTALATATALTLSVGAASAQEASMGMGFNMLTGSVYNALVANGLPTDGINDLSLAQIAQIKAVLDDDMSSGQKGRIKAIMENQ